MLDSTVSDNEVHIHGYEIVRRDRNLNGSCINVSVYDTIWNLMSWKIYAFQSINLDPFSIKRN
jgi:hypothetical protein